MSSTGLGVAREPRENPVQVPRHFDLYCSPAALKLDNRRFAAGGAEIRIDDTTAVRLCRNTPSLKGPLCLGIVGAAISALGARSAPPLLGVILIGASLLFMAWMWLRSRKSQMVLEISTCRNQVFRIRSREPEILEQFAVEIRRIIEKTGPKQLAGASPLAEPARHISSASESSASGR